MNKILIILAFSINCFDPLIRDDKDFDALIKKFMTEDDAWMEDIPEDFMPDTDPLDISEDEDDDIKYV